MSEYKHTPGPWWKALAYLNLVDKRLEVFEIYNESESQWIAVVLSVKDGSKEKGEANARLIAAAPSLLTALINLLEHREGTEEGNKARKEAELLIQKIRGHE